MQPDRLERTAIAPHAATRLTALIHFPFRDDCKHRKAWFGAVDVGAMELDVGAVGHRLRALLHDGLDRRSAAEQLLVEIATAGQRETYRRLADLVDRYRNRAAVEKIHNCRVTQHQCVDPEVRMVGRKISEPWRYHRHRRHQERIEASDP